MSIRRSKAAVAVALLAALTLVPTIVAPVAAKNTQDAEHARILKYWTAERIANAKPRDFVRTPGGGFKKGPGQNAKPPDGHWNVSRSRSAA